MIGKRTRRWSTAAAILFIVTMMNGCGYRFAATSANRLTAGSSVWVGFIANETTNPYAQTIVRRALLQECHHLRGLKPAGEQNDADYFIAGRIRSYSTSPISYTAADQIREYRLSIAVELELKRRGDAVPLWKGQITGTRDFPVSADLALQRNAEEAALAAASVLVADQFISATEQAY